MNNHTGRAGEEYKMLTRAHARVAEILERPFEYGAPPAAVQRIKDYVRAHAAAKGVAPPAWTEATPSPVSANPAGGRR